MKKVFTLFLILPLTTLLVHAQCVEYPKNRVLLVGDSWAAFMNADQTITHALRNAGHSDKKYTTSLAIAENGAETDDFLGVEKQTEIQALIDANPDIDMIHLSIGGNDVLGDWHISFTQEQTDSLENAVALRLEAIVEFLKSTRPGMRIFWAGYTYPNFGEVINDIAPAQSVHPFYSTWDGMGQPDFLTINTILNNFSDSVGAYADSEPQMDFVSAQGILQHIWGQPQPLTTAPGGTYPAFSAPIPLGYPEYPSPKATMRPYGFFTDCFHLSTEAYLAMCSYQTQKFYQKYFMDDLYILSSGAANDGSVSSAGDVSQVLKVGEEGGNELALALTFNTQQMADTTLAGASLFLRRESVSGTHPLASQTVQIKMKSGNFGTSANVEAVDFTESGDVEGEPCVHGMFAADGQWFRLDLTVEMIANINNSAQTQFLISVPGFTGGFMTVSDATDPELAPILNLKYGTAPDAVNEILAAKELPVYPIPTVGPLTIDADNAHIRSIEVLSVLGNSVLKPTVSNNSIDISSLANGSYVLRIVTDEGISTKRIIKR